MYLNRGRILGLITYIPVAIVMMSAENFFLMIGIDPLVASETQSYVFGMLPYILFYSQFDLVRTFLYCFKYAAIPVSI